MSVPSQSGWRIGLIAAGVTAGAVSIYPPLYRALQPAGPGFEGLWFGLALGLYCLVTGRSRSLMRALSLTLVSAAACWVAFLSAVFVHVTVYRDSPNPGVVDLFAGGVVGASILSSTTFLLYGGTRVPLRDRILFCSAGGGILGAAGYLLGNAVQKSPYPSQGFSTAVLFFVWQTGLAALMAIAWPVPAESPAAMPREARVPLFAKVLIVLIAIPMVWVTVQSQRTRAGMKEGQEKLEVYFAQRPSLENLPPLVARPDDQVVILRPIAGRPNHSLGHGLQNADVYRSQRIEYVVCYMFNPSDRCGANPPAVDVRVTQYPTPQWALYAVKGTSVGGGYGAGLNREAVVTKFGQRILQPPVGRTRSEFYWASGVYVVHVMSDIPETDEFIRLYLERYPSSM